MISNLARALILCAAFAGAPLKAQFKVAETGERFARLQDAVYAIGEGAGTIHIAPGRYDDCAVQEAGRIAYVAEKAGTALFDGGICEDKATLVLRGRSARIEGLVFAHTEVEDGNGAGIRIEQGDLVVSLTRFVDSQCGILSGNDPSSTITIDRSTFSGLGKHPDYDGVHSIYINHYGAVRVTRSRFERGTSGHYLKSRSGRIEVLDSSFDDSRGSNTNYMIDLSEGATGRIAGNTFVNGTGKDNYSTMISVAPEDQTYSSAGLVIEDNDVSLAPGFRWTTTFVGNWSRDQLVVRDNRLARGIALLERR